MAKSSKDSTIDILKLEEGRLDFYLLGVTPIILNRLSEKVQRELLLPKGRKTAADKAASLKHNPLEEFRSSPYTDPNPDSPTLIQFLATAFKGAMMEAALDMPGVNKSQIKRLVWVDGERVSLYGVPQMILSPVRSADMNRTPDIRSRAIITEWACKISIAYRKPILREQGVVNLLAAAGTTPGVGDWRVGKGSGNFGRFQIVGKDDKQLGHVLKVGGRKAQEAALETPEFYDRETEELFFWWQQEARERGFDIDVPAPAGNGHAEAHR